MYLPPISPLIIDKLERDKQARKVDVAKQKAKEDLSERRYNLSDFRVKDKYIQLKTDYYLYSSELEVLERKIEKHQNYTPWKHIKTEWEDDRENYLSFILLAVVTGSLPFWLCYFSTLSCVKKDIKKWKHKQLETSEKLISVVDELEEFENKYLVTISEDGLKKKQPPVRPTPPEDRILREGELPKPPKSYR